MNVFLIKGIILFVVLLFIVIPFFLKEDARFTEDYDKSKVHDLVSQKEIVMGTIIDLEYDYKMGKLSKKDYQTLKTQMKNEAAHLFKQIDQINAEKKNS